MRQRVAHLIGEIPWNLGMASRERRMVPEDIVAAFADHLEVANNRVLGLPVRQISGSVQACGVVPDIGDGFGDVFQVCSR